MEHVKMTGTSFIREASPGSTTKRRGQAILPMLVPFPIACFAGALITDLVYWRTPDALWERFSIWLITARLIIAWFAATGGGASRCWFPARSLAIADKCLRSQPRLLYRNSTDGPDAFRTRRGHSAGHGLGGLGLGLSRSHWRDRMTRAFKIKQSPKLRRLAVSFAAISLLGLTGCDDNGGDPNRQVGANPVLPALQQYLMPPIRIAKVAAWGNEAPTVPQGMQVHALATGFEHPRSLYVLPNGDVLVVESNGPKAPIHRPKDIVTSWVTWFAGADAKGGNRITLLRDTNGDGIPEV